MGDHVVERWFGDAERVRRDEGARLVQGGEQNSQTGGRNTEQILPRHATVGEREGCGRRAAMAHLVLEPLDVETSRSLFEDKDRDRALGIVDLAPFAE